MTRVRAAAVRHPVAAYCVGAFVFSWSYWGWLLARGERVGPGSATSHLPGLLGPFLAAAAVTALTQGRAGLRRFLLGCVSLRGVGWRSGLLALSPLLAGALVLAVLAALRGHAPAWQDFASYPGVPPSWPLGAMLLFALVLNGIGEEAGWRGFALPQLMQRHAPLPAALRVAAMWLPWHAPLFVLNTSMAQLLGPALLGWALGLVAGAVVLAWVYLVSRSILVVAVWHTLFNLMVATAPGRGAVAAVLSTAVMLMAVVVALRWSRQRVTLADPPSTTPPTRPC